MREQNIRLGETGVRKKRILKAFEFRGEVDEESQYARGGTGPSRRLNFSEKNGGDVPLADFLSGKEEGRKINGGFI